MSQAEDKSRRDAVVEAVAKQLFPFPSVEHPNWVTYVNKPHETKGVKVDSEMVYPDIVVGDEENTVVMLGEVATEMTMSAGEAERWRKLYSICSDLFLYVPADMMDEARQLITEHNVRLCGLSLYSYDPQGQLIVHRLWSHTLSQSDKAVWP